MFSSLSEESVSTSVLKSLLQRNSSDVRLKQWGDLRRCGVGLVCCPTVRVPPLHVKSEMWVVLLINDGHAFFQGGGGGRERSWWAIVQQLLIMVFLLTIQRWEEKSWIESQGNISLTCLRHSRQTANGVICSLLIETIAFKSDLSFHSKTDIFVRSHAGSLCIKQVCGPHSQLFFSSKAIQTISFSVFSKVWTHWKTHNQLRPSKKEFRAF